MPPTMLIDALETVRRKVKLLGVAYGVGILLAVAAGGLLAATLLDYVLNLPSVPRLIVLLAAVAAVGHVLYRYVIRPGMSRLTLSDIAGKVESVFPQFDDRLRSTVNFIGAEVPGSDAMKQRVVGEATSLASQLDLNRAVITTPAWYSMAAGVGAIAGLMLLSTFVIGPTYRDIALARLFMPFANHAWPKRVQIDLVGELPQRMPVGQRLPVRMKLSKGDRESMKAVVFYQYDDGPVQQEFMTRGGDGVYAASLDTRVESGKSAAGLKVWMRAGDDEKHLNLVTVVPRLGIKAVEALITPPPYVNQSQSTMVNLTAAPAVMATGSTVAVHVAFNKPLADDVQPQVVPITEGAKAPAIKWTRDGRLEAIGTFVAAESIRFHLRATDIDNFSNSALEEYELIVRPDQMPSVQIENPRRSEERTAVAAIPLQGLAEDDYGVLQLKLVVDRLADKRHWEINLVEDSQATKDVSWARAETSGDRQRFRVNYNWDLAQLEQANLKPGDVLEYSLQAVDNYVLNGQTHDPVSSGKLRISIISQDELTNRIVNELRQTKDQIGNVKNVEARTKQETANLLADTRDKPHLDAADRSAADRLTNQQATAASQAKALAGKMEAIQQKLEENKSPAQELKDLSRDVKNDLNRAAEGSMKDATQSLNNTQQPNQPADQRNNALDKAQQDQSKAVDQLQGAMDRMSNIGTMAQTIERIAALLAEQKEITKQTADAGRNHLGKRIDDLKPEDRKKLEDAADRQAKLAERTGKAMEDMKKMSDQMSKSDPSSSQAMSNAARTAQSQQVQPKQQQASSQARQNHQADAQQAQKGAELGLEMMLNELREAERARLAELSKKLEELQKQIATLIRRQAGHNLDNLAGQGGAIVAKEDPAIVGELVEKSERDPATTQPGAPAAPSIAQQGQSQEQTERNTRDIGKAAEAMPNGAEPSAHLTRAAGKMERAIFSLRDNKLPEAYDPSQVEALASLEAAKKLVDEQKNKVDDQISDNDRETIRQKYVKIKDDQEKLNGETARINSARDPRGELPRPDAIKLGQMPGEQGKLSDRVSSIDKDLAAVGSIVYIWANKDIVSSMNDVKADLGKPDTGTPTQAEQKRIVEQLDAMIRNLATKPKESKFAQNGGGGQCKSGGPKLPTEAELRLLKELQLAINRNTKIVDAQPAKDKDKLLALGTRQGELRNLLDQLLQKASNGETKLGPEPDKLAQLPEESVEEDVDNQELDKNLLNDKPDTDKEEKQAMLVGDRMARSRQRLALNNDPGKVTQLIQDRITKDLDDLIDQAREQQAQTRNQPPSNKPGQKMSKPGEQTAQASNQGKKPGQSKPNTSVNPAQTDSAPGPAARQTDLSQDIKESMAEWGGISPRVREAVIEGADDQVIEEYRKLVEDYWKAVSTKAKER